MRLPWARMEHSLHADKQWHESADGKTKGMECGKRIEHDVAFIECDMRAHLLNIGKNVGVRKHHTLGLAFRARGEENDRRSIGRGVDGNDSRHERADHCRALVEGGEPLSDVFQIDQLRGRFELSFQRFEFAELDENDAR